MCMADIDHMLQVDQQWPRRYYIKSIVSPNFYAYLARIEDQYAGNVMFRILEPNLLIDKIGVMHAFRRWGIGAKLLEKAMVTGRLKNAKNVSLTVSQSNISAIKFYTTQGFKIDSLQADYYSEGDHGVKMYRKI